MHTTRDSLLSTADVLDGADVCGGCGKPYWTQYKRTKLPECCAACEPDIDNGGSHRAYE